MNKLFKFALAALPMLMLASCAKDDLGNEAPKAEKSETRYLKVTLSTPSASPDSRAGIVGNYGEYQDGTVEENKIRTLEFYFYDSEGQYHSYVPMTVAEMPLDPTVNPRPEEKPNIGGFYHCNVPVELTQGQKLPNYVVCIVNSVEGTQYQSKTMAEAQASILSSYYGSEHTTSSKPGETGTADYFGMSNSVYYGSDPVTGHSGELVMAAPFTTDKLLTESQLAKLAEQATGSGTDKNEIENYTINIPVERYAAKVNLDLSSLTTETMPPYTVYSETTEEGKATTETPITLTFTPKKWAVNATEKTFYFLKSFRTPSTTEAGMPSDIFATETDLNTILFDGWNNPYHKRCFWARTPGYYRDNYPLTSDDVIDNRNDGNDKNNFDLTYLSWNECEDITDLSAKLHQYTTETTMKVTRLTGEDMSDQYLPTASLPSVILLGQYKVGEAAEGTDFYLYGRASNGAYKVYSNETTLIPGTKKVKEQMLFDQTILLRRIVNADGTTTHAPINTIEQLNTVNANLYGTNLIVEHPSERVRNFYASTETVTGSQLKIAADVVALQLKGSPTGLYFYNPNAGAYQEITTENIDHVNLLLYQNLGGAHYYKNGMAYFNAPIQHWGWHRANNFNTTQVEVKDKDDKVIETRDRTMAEWDWKQMKTGDFGIVRNHVYTMKIGSIKGLGTGISDPDVPIVPPADKVKYAVHFHVNIQKWAVLPTQEWNW